MTIKKHIHPARKAFRGFLCVCMLGSFLFLSGIVYLRMNYHHIRDNPELRNTLFKADVLKHQAQAYWADDEGDVTIAVSLINKGLFSSIYSKAGFKMLRDNADNGSPASQTKHADLIIAYRMGADPNRRAAHYYQLAAAQNYAPAIEKLSVLHSANSR
jgi:TPR repeat protein